MSVPHCACTLSGTASVVKARLRCLHCFGRAKLMSSREMKVGSEGEQLHTGQRLAILVPCFNEEAAIAKVVADFRTALPGAFIYVYDNNSSDRTIGGRARRRCRR